MKALPYQASSPDELREQIRLRDHKLYVLRQECKALQTAVAESEAKLLRAENHRLRQALSFIAFAPDNGGKAGAIEVARKAVRGGGPTKAEVGWRSSLDALYQRLTEYERRFGRLQAQEELSEHPGANATKGSSARANPETQPTASLRGSEV